MTTGEAEINTFLVSRIKCRQGATFSRNGGLHFTHSGIAAQKWPIEIDLPYEHFWLRDAEGLPPVRVSSRVQVGQ